ncbi:MAG: stage II sporulation protein R [Clostridia bacterium]|nr:stage II sporulation protein R [Clostridia bacterium]
MITTIVSLLAAATIFFSTSISAQDITTWQLKTGYRLRMHVVAHDDTEEMQRIKLCVRDAVQACYTQNAPASGTSLQKTRAILPELTEAATAAARAEGFTGDVAVTLETCYFDDRELSTMTIPAGDYPALMIRLGDAQGQNWWGLIDPLLSLWCARVPDMEAEPITWDWSWQAFIAALTGRTLAEVSF